MRTTTENTRTVSYSRRKDVGKITLGGTCDIFEAAVLKDVLGRAASDSAANSLVVDCNELDRIDASAAQLLTSFSKACIKTQKAVSFANVPIHVEKYLVICGVSVP